MNNELLNVILEDIQFVDIMTTDMLEEGATWETYQTVFSTNTRKIKNSYKQANSLYRQGKNKEALAKIKECKEGYIRIKTELNKIDDSFLGDVCGIILGGGIFSLFATIKAGGSSGAVEFLTTALIDTGFQLLLGPIGMVLGRSIKLIRNKNKGIDTSNLAKSDIIAAIDENIKMCEKLEKRIKDDK